MSNSCVLQRRPLTVTIAVMACLSGVLPVGAQSPQGKSAPNGLIPILGADPFGIPTGMRPANQQPTYAHQAPLAHLIENPDQTDGTPPYALTDRTGTIQRYVEPVPGIDLAQYVGQVVVVRNDTGPTLLASQLQLPSQPLYPMLNERGPARPNNRAYAAPRRSPGGDFVEQAQYVDDDDSSVQLLPDGGPPQGNAVPIDMMGGPGYSAGYPNGMMMPPMGGPGGDQQFYDPMQGGPGAMQPFPGPMAGPYQPYAPYQDGAVCAPAEQSDLVKTSADVEFLFLRPRITEDVAGKLSESYEFSPRFIFEVRNFANLDVRARYWHYGRDTKSITNNADIRLELDVLDIEAVHRFEVKRSELAVSAGIRLANFRLEDLTDQKSATNQIGLTMAADGLTPLNSFSGGYCGWVYGGRFSLLGGNWGGDDGSAFVNHRVSDDNMLVTELYAGMEVARRCGIANVRARALFEVQSWKSDVLATNAGIESVGFLGPGLQIGADF